MGIIRNFIKLINSKPSGKSDLTAKISFENELLDGIQKGIDYCIKSKTKILAAVNGVADDQFYIGYCYLHGDKGFPVNYDKAEYWLKMSSQQGHVSAMYDLGQVYMANAGHFTTESNDLNLAFSLFTKAAAQGNPAAQRRVGMSYFYGQFHEKDEALGIELLTKAANAGDAIAQDSLGNKYRLGIYLKKDLDLAEHYLRRSANQEYYEAFLSLGELLWERGGHFACSNSLDRDKDLLYLLTSSLPEDKASLKKVCLDFNSDWGVEAFHWFEKAQETGKFKNSDSMYNPQYFLGLCYKFGLGVKQNIEKGNYYLQEAYRLRVADDAPTSDITAYLNYQI